MQSAITKRTGKNVVRPYCGRSGSGSIKRRPPEKKDYSGRRSYRTGFLKQTLEVVPVKPDFEEKLAGGLFSDESFDYLTECAVHYAGLLGKTIEIPSGMAHERLNKLYRQFAELLPERQALNIEYDNSKARWVVCRFHNWDGRTFYWMPVKFITLLSGQMREIAMSFMSLFIRKNGLTSFGDSYEFDYFFEWSEENIISGDYDEQEKEEYYKLIKSYSNGDISVFLNSVYKHKPVDIVKALKEYEPATPQEVKLLECFRKGLPFVSGDDNIMSYYYDPYMECYPGECEDVTPVTLDRLCLVRLT